LPSYWSVEVVGAKEERRKSGQRSWWWLVAKMNVLCYRRCY
jgi:hypothetical protein